MVYSSVSYIYNLWIIGHPIQRRLSRQGKWWLMNSYIVWMDHFMRYGIRYYFSIAPIVVRSPQKQTLVKNVPLSNLLLESDAPALGPEKGVDNEPANLIMAAREIARIKDISIDQVVRISRYSLTSYWWWLIDWRNDTQCTSTFFMLGRCCITWLEPFSSFDSLCGLFWSLFIPLPFPLVLKSRSHHDHVQIRRVH